MPVTANNVPLAVDTYYAIVKPCFVNYGYEDAISPEVVNV